MLSKNQSIFIICRYNRKNLRLVTWKGARDRDDGGLIQSLNIEAYVKTNETDETASVDVFVRKIRTGQEMHSRMKALGHDKHRFIKTGAQPGAVVITKNYPAVRLRVSPSPRKGVAARCSELSSVAEPRSELPVLALDALQMQHRHRLFVL